MNKINAIYFSCERDADMLENSIDSLRLNYPINRIIVANDLNDPILRKIPGVEIINKKKSSEKLYGLENIGEMLSFFKFASNDCDYIQKIDSDTLVCSDLAYRNLEEGKWDAYGSFPMAIPEMIPPRHFAGPSYFLRSSLAAKLFDFGFPKTVHDWAWMKYPEDMVISDICNHLTQNIQVDGTAMHKAGKYLFDTYLTKIAGCDKSEITKYGFAHCRTNPYVLRYIKEKIYVK